MSTLLNLSQNTALLLALTFIYDFIYPYLERVSRQVRDLLNGILFGAFAVIVMATPLQVADGVFYDSRVVFLCIAGLYGGPIPVTIAMLMVCIYRVWAGGVGLITGVGGAVMTAAFAILLYVYFQRRAAKPNTRQLLLIGLVLALGGMVWLSFLPGVGLGILNTWVPLTLITYPLGMLLVGKLLNRQQSSVEVEQALRESEARFRAIFDSTFQFMGLLKPDGTLVEVNQAARTFVGVESAELIGQPFWETPWWRISAETQSKLKDAIKRAALGEFVRYEVDIWDAGKHAVTIDFSLKPLRNDEGRIILLIPEGRDISSLKELEQQKVDLVLERERARLLKKFISDVSHDLRTPLSVMRLNLELLRRTADEPKQQQRIDIIAAQEQHLTRLLTDMMIMLSLDDTQGTFNFKPLDLNFLAQLVFDSHRSAALRKQQKLILNRAPDPLPVQADQIEIERALGKLLINALSYTPSGGSITLNILKQDSSAVLEICDTGIGISADDLPNIFQRFFRADLARSMDTGGTGLGLPIAKKIVEVHGGRIDVESLPDTGSTFRVFIPLIVSEIGSTVAAAPLYR